MDRLGWDEGKAAGRREEVSSGKSEAQRVEGRRVEAKKRGQNV